MTDFSQIKKYDPFMEQVGYCIEDFKRFFRIDTKPGHMYVRNKDLFKQYLAKHYTMRVVDTATRNMRNVWGKVL